MDKADYSASIFLAKRVEGLFRTIEYLNKDTSKFKVRAESMTPVQAEHLSQIECHLTSMLASLKGIDDAWTRILDLERKEEPLHPVVPDQVHPVNPKIRKAV